MHIALRRIRTWSLTALLAGAGAAGAQPAQQGVGLAAPDSEQTAPPVRPVAPPRAGRRPAGEPADPQVADPVRACFEAARDITVNQRAGRGIDEAAYTCDLAVQVARDLTDASGRPDRRALAATLANRSLVLAGAGRLQPALRDLDEALGLTPQNAALYGNRGNLLLRLNRPVDALDAQDQAIALAPRDPAGYVNRAFSHRALGNAVAAAEDVERARALGASAAVRQPGTDAGDADRGQ